MAGVPVALLVLVFASLGLLGIGFFWKARERHLLRVAGFVGIGVFWGFRAWLYVEQGSDAVNIAFTGLAFPFFAYLGYHEWLSFDKDEEVEALRWATGATFLAGTLYFAVDQIEVVTSALIQVVAYQSLWLMNLFGFGVGWWVAPTGPIGDETGALIVGSEVTIILGCTSYEAIVIFFGAVFATRMRADPWADYKQVDEKSVAKLRAMTPERRKWLGLLYTVPLIWVLNLFRNAGVIYLFKAGTFAGTAASWGMLPFDFVHVVIGKGLSFVALIIIAFMLFRTCPEILDNVNGLMDLPRRGKKRGTGGSGEPPMEPVPEESPEAPEEGPSLPASMAEAGSGLGPEAG